MTFVFADVKTQYHSHGRMHVQGGVLPNAITAYRTYGDRKNPCIVFPTCFGATLDSQSYLIGSDKALNPKNYFIITFALFANGESSSPSNTPMPYNGPYFPAVSYKDNVKAQYAVLQHLGIKKVFMVVGFSMGGQQAYYWPVMYPDVVERYVPICGSARTSPHNQCFIEGPKSALLASKDFHDGHYTSRPDIGLRAFARVYSAWAYGQAWFRQNNHLYNGQFPDINSFLREHWERDFTNGWDANDLVILLNTWQEGDVSQIRDNGDLKKCLGSIKAKGLIMPGKTDLYFPPEDSENEVACMLNTAKLVVIPSVWGHMAGSSYNPDDVIFVTRELKKFMEEP